MFRHLTNRVSTVLCVSSLGLLVIGIEITTDNVLFEQYISAFFGWALIFALVAHFTRPREDRSL